MKISYVVATSDVRWHENMNASQGDLHKIFLFLREMEYEGVELMVRDPDLVDHMQIERLSSACHIEIPLINTVALFDDDGLSFMDAKEETREEALLRTKRVIDFAELFGAQVSIGKLRGQLNLRIPEKESITWLIDAFRRLTDYASQKKVVLTLEPIARILCNNINSIREGIAYIESINSKYFRLMADLFHMNLEEKSMEDGFFQAKPFLSHVHVSDSNRLAPGRGNLDFKAITDMLKRIEYQGYLSAEIRQFPSQDIAIVETSQVFKELTN